MIDFFFFLPEFYVFYFFYGEGRFDFADGDEDVVVVFVFGEGEGVPCFRVCQVCLFYIVGACVLDCRDGYVL